MSAVLELMKARLLPRRNTLQPTSTTPCRQGMGAKQAQDSTPLCEKPVGLPKGTAMNLDPTSAPLNKGQDCSGRVPRKGDAKKMSETIDQIKGILKMLLLAVAWELIGASPLYHMFFGT